MTPRTVWLASFPKSGNTWVRAVVTALSTHPHLFGVDQLSHGAQPHHVAGALPVFGLDPRWLTIDELDALRVSLIRHADDFAPGDSALPLFRKTHEAYRAGAPGREPFPTDATRAAILIVRDPRDVVCSWAPFFGISIDGAIEAIATDGGEQSGNAALAQTAQPWATWSTHAQSWLADDLPFPVHLVRYEDLQRVGARALLPALLAVGLECSEDHLDQAFERAAFDRLRESEDERGFHETSTTAQRFFRSGQSGSWRVELSREQAALVESSHATVMQRLGYFFTPPIGFDLAIVSGPIPEQLTDAQLPRPWIQVTPRQVLVKFRGGAGILVSDGTDVVVDGADRGDVEWMVQGWAMTLAALQRGMLSIHASTVDVAGCVTAIAGERGAGKSTTSLALVQRGHRLLCDDVTVIEFRDDGPWTTPYWRNVHLMSDAATALGVDFDALPPLGPGRMKSAFRPEHPGADRTRLDRIVVLERTTAVTSVEIEEVRGAKRVMVLTDHARRDGVAPLVLGEAQYFAHVARLADSLPVFVIRRPLEPMTLDEVTAGIEGLE